MTHYNGYCGNNYDKWVAKNSNTSALGKVQKQFWFTKSAVIRKFGKREDEYIVASDAELDAKIELFKAIESSTKELQALLADYQNKICILAQEENTLGRLLKEYGKQDQTRAGKMMLAVGKSLSYTAQQRVALRNPLVRLFQEVDTFQSRAVEDTGRTVEEMEKVRTEYRGALMWMKNISQDFNPDHYQQLEKFREVQNLVKQKKSKFDQIKIKSLQKIELLAASRCNMFSHALILYQNNLITFSEKTAKTLNSVASNFKGYHPYKFHVIKELAESTEIEEPEEDKEKREEMEGDDKTFFDAEYHDDEKAKPQNKSGANTRSNNFKKKEKLGRNSGSLVNLFSNEENTQLLSIENGNTENVGNDSSSSFTNVDLMSGDIPASDSSNTTELLKELFESPVRQDTTKGNLPVYGGSEITSKGIPDQKNASETGFSSQMFLPSHLLDYGLRDGKPQNLGLPNKPNAVGGQFSLLEASTGFHETHTNTNFSQYGANFIPSHAIDESVKESERAKNLRERAKVDWYKVFQDIDPLADPGNAIFGKGARDKC